MTVTPQLNASDNFLKLQEELATTEDRIQRARRFYNGNVRELKNLIERAVLLGDGPLLNLRDVGAAPDCQGAGATVGGTAVGLPALTPDGIDLPDVMAAIEKEYYEESLRIADGNESRAARSLNVSRDTFRYRRKKLFG